VTSSLLHGVVNW